MSCTSKSSPLKSFSSYSFSWREVGSAGRASGTVICSLEKHIPLRVSLLGHPRVTLVPTQLSAVSTSLLLCILTQATNQPTSNSSLTFPECLCIKHLSKLPSTVVCWWEMSTPSENRHERCAKVCRDPSAGVLSLQQTWDVLAGQL